MKNDYLQPNQTNRRALKWVFYSILAALLVCLIVVIMLYNQVENHKIAGFSETKQQVLDETDVTDIDKIERFHGDDAYHIVYGQTSDDVRQIIFVPFAKDDKDILTFDQSEMITKEAVKSAWTEQCENCELIKLVPGILKDDYVWELTYVEPTGRYVFEYLSLYNGESYEMFRFKQLFK